MNKENFLILLSKKISTGLDQQEKIDYDLYLHQHADYKPVADSFRAYMNYRDSTLDQEQQANLKKLSSKLNEAPIPKKKSISKTSHIVKLASLSAVAAILLVVLWYRDNNEHSSATIDVTSFMEIASGQNQSLFSMADGTIVTLDKNATLFVHSEFGQQQRQVRLVGNARFDVVKNTNIPMRIHLSNWEVVVTGTSFDIIQDTLLDQNELSLFNGEVQLKPTNSAEKTVKILPNQKVTWKSENKHISDLKISQISANERLNSQNQFRDSIVFKNQHFINLAKKLQEIYRVKIYFENENLQQRRFSGVLYKMSLEEFLEAMKTTYPFEYERRDSLVFIR